jgi:RecA/RadA recombinase
LDSNSALSVESLRALLPRPLPDAPGLPTGLDALDDALASGGFPRGRLTEVVGASGTLTLLRHVVQAAVERGEWVAYIDASRTLAPREWSGLDDRRLWIVRPPAATHGAWCADVLLRSAAFSLVVLDSAPTVSRAIAVRLMGLARDSNAAFVVVGAREATRLGGAVRLHVHRRRQRLRIEIQKGFRAQGAGIGVRGTGKNQNQVEINCVIGVARRLCSYPEVPDRRGVARSSGKRGRGRAAAPVT